MSQFVGDLEHYEAFRAFEETIRDLMAMYEIAWQDVLVVHDAHPEYRSTVHALHLPSSCHLIPTRSLTNRLERYRLGQLDGYTNIQKRIYYHLRPFTNRSLRRQIQKLGVSKLAEAAISHWPVDVEAGRPRTASPAGTCENLAS